MTSQTLELPFTSSVKKGMTFEDCVRAAVKLHTFTSITRAEYKGEIDEITCALWDIGRDWDDVADLIENSVAK